MEGAVGIVTVLAMDTLLALTVLTHSLLVSTAVFVQTFTVLSDLEETGTADAPTQREKVAFLEACSLSGTVLRFSLNPHSDPVGWSLADSPSRG